MMVVVVVIIVLAFALSKVEYVFDDELTRSAHIMILFNIIYPVPSFPGSFPDQESLNPLSTAMYRALAP